MSKKSFSSSSADRASDVSQSTTTEGSSITSTVLDNTHPMIRALYYRAVDAVDDQSSFQDHIAKDLADRFHDQFKVFGEVPNGMKLLMITRTLLIDLQCVQFMEYHSQRGRTCAVLNLSGGLDTRVYRLEPKAHVRWYEVDRPAWIELRRQLVEPYTPTGDNVRFISHDVVNRTGTGPSESEEDNENGLDAWLREVPGDTPTLILMEATAAYFKKPRFDRFIRRLLDHFDRGELLMDVFGRAATFLATHHWLPWARRIGAHIEWSCEDPTSLQKIHPKLKLADARSCVSMAEEEHDEYTSASAVGKMQLGVLKSGLLGGAVAGQLRVVRLTYS